MAENIFSFVPNIIDYMRLVFAFASFYFMQSNYKLAALLYLLSVFLDEVDGYFARALNQESKFGNMLDMLTDRITSMCLLAALCHFYPKYMIFFQISMAVDIFSHWLYLHSTNMKESKSHKVLDLAANPILRHYYHNKIILSFMCVTNELFYCLLYVNYFTPGPIIAIGNFSVGIYTLIMYICAPFSFVKSFISFIQLIVGSHNMAAIDVADREQMKKSN